MMCVSLCMCIFCIFAHTHSGKSVLEMVCACFERQAMALDKDGATLLTDSSCHHCWTLPPSFWFSLADEAGGGGAEGVGGGRGAEGGGQVGQRGRQDEVRELMKGKSCNCGSVSFSDLPPHTTWNILSPSPLLPLAHLHSDISGSPFLVKQSTVCDLLTPRLAALECASELAQTLLSTAFTITHQH